MPKTQVLSSNILREGLWSLQEAVQPAARDEAERVFSCLAPVPQHPCSRGCPFPLKCPPCWGHRQGPQPWLEGESGLSAVLLDTSVPSGHHLETRAMHLPKRHLSTAVMCGVNRGVTGGELTAKESVGLGDAALRGFGEKSWGKKRCPHIDPHFTSCSHLVHWHLGLCTAHHKPRNLIGALDLVFCTALPPLLQQKQQKQESPRAAS